MFSAKRRIFESVARRRVALPKASALVAALSVGLASCALQVHEGDGLVSDGREVQISPTLGSTRPPAGGQMMGKGCKQLELFKQVVMPMLSAEFQGIPQGIPNEVLTPQSCISCHDTKTKAISVLLMDAKDPDLTCTVTYVRQLLEGDVVASSDPNMRAKEHEFKFARIEDYNRFRDALQMWISAEGIVTMAKPTP